MKNPRVYAEENIRKKNKKVSSKKNKKDMKNKKVASSNVKTQATQNNSPNKVIKTAKAPGSPTLALTKMINKKDSRELKRHMFIFKSMTKKAKNRDIILKKAPLTLFKTIRVLFNLMKGGAIPLTNAQRSRLKPWINFIRQNSKGSDTAVKTRVSQNGNGLGSILKTILPIIAPILSMLI